MRRISQTDIYEGSWLLRPDAANVGDYLRQIGPDDLATSTGTVIISASSTGRNYAASPSGEVYEIHSYGIEPYTRMQWLVNEALKNILVPVDFSFAPTEELTVQDLTAQQSWLTNAKWVREIGTLTGDSQAQVQTLTESGSPTGGTFTVSSREGTTATIAFDATAATMQTRLRTLPQMGSVTVTRTGTTTDFVWTVTMTGAPIDQQLLTADVALLTGGSSPTVTAAISTTSGNRNMGTPSYRRLAPYQVAQRVFVDFGSTYQDTARIYIRAYKPAYNHCRTASTGAASYWGAQSGLSAEAHETPVIAEWVGAQMLVLAWASERAKLQAAGIRREQMLEAADLCEAWQRAEFQQIVPIVPAKAYKALS